MSINYILCCCSVTESLSCVWLCDPMDYIAHQAPLSSTVSRSLLKFTSIESVMPSNHLILCYPLLLVLSTFPSIRVFSNELALRIRWPKYWSFSSSPSRELSRLISFRIDWFDLLALQGTLKSLFQHHSPSALSLLYSPALTSIYDYWKKIITLTRRNFCRQSDVSAF